MYIIAIIIVNKFTEEELLLSKIFSIFATKDIYFSA